MHHERQPPPGEDRPTGVEPAVRTGAALLLGALLLVTQTARYPALEADQRTAFLLAAAAALTTLTIPSVLSAGSGRGGPRARRITALPPLTLLAAVGAAVWMAADMATQ